MRGLAVLSLLALAAAAPTKRQHGVEVINNCKVSGQVALTFDDGPSGDLDVTIGQNLNGGKGTFFFNGNNYECIYDRADQVKSLHADGHTLGSHTWSHADLTSLDWNGINDELEKVEQAFIKILGLKPLYFRPPYGNINDLVLQVLGSRGYKKVFLWSEDTGDSTGASTGSSESVYDGINDYPNPHLVLNHSPLTGTAYDVIPYAVSNLQSKGYQLVAVDTCLGSDGEWPYEYVGEPGSPDGSWTC